MKKIILSFLLFSKMVFGQESSNKTIYLDSLFNETTRGNHKYYRVIKDYYLDKKTYMFTDYYSSGKIVSQALSTNKEYLINEGEFITYYENGNKKTRTTYEEGVINGKCSYWYENGEKKIDGEFIPFTLKDTNFQILKIINYWDENEIQKVTDGNGYFKDDECFFYYKVGLISEGKIKDGFKDGIWTGNDKQTGLTFEENYENGVLISGTSIDKNNEKHYYSVVEKKPDVKGGMLVFYNYIKKNFKTTNIPGLKGKIITNFIINENGEVCNLKITRSLHPDVDKEAIRVLTNFKDFSPAVQRGIKVKCSYTIPISIETPNE